MKRKTLAQYLREGHALAGTDLDCRGGYYVVAEHPEIGDLWGIDPILMIFVGKFGTDILKSIGAEHRRDFDHGWDAGRVWDREHVTERLTKAINGGLWELHRRLIELPRLYSTIHDLGFRAPRQYTSVFRAITYMNDAHHYGAGQIATVLEESRL